MRLTVTANHQAWITLALLGSLLTVPCFGQNTSDESVLWSIQPQERPEVPAGTSTNPVDRFVVSKLTNLDLKPSPIADRRTLIRRLYFDLVGLPPTPAQVAAFVSDESEDAYEQLVDQLLASPHYGERWARHWLDVVHFGETHGYDKDKPRPNAWPYRDYVIRAFNEDKSWSRFIEEQIAGDVLYPHTRDGIEALGFIAAGPWDFIGHAEVPETKIDGKIARHLDRDDMVANTMQSFNSLTVQCAQCHDHKFDPVSQEDYYSLQAVFAALDRANREYDRDPAVALKRQDLETRENYLTTEEQRIRSAIEERAGPELTEINEAKRILVYSRKQAAAFGYHSQIESSPDVEKWVQVNLGSPVRIRRVELFPTRDSFNNIGDGFGFPVRYHVAAADDEAFTENVRRLADFTNADVPNPGIEPQGIPMEETVARYVRVTATRLAPRQDDYMFALAELRVIDVDGNNVAAGAEVVALDSVEAPERWSTSNLTDDWHPARADELDDEFKRLETARQRRLFDQTRPSEQARLEEIRHELKTIREERDRLPPTQLVYVGTVHSGSGTFKGTGAEGGKPRPIHRLARGDVRHPREVVVPGTVSMFPELNARFDLPPDHQEGDRRVALAEWLTHPDNPLTWRSIVNRVWQQHFGQGIVDTPNDFGVMGGRPSHPELLDWLACEFRDNGQSLKQLHRLIVTSRAYRQRSTTINERALEVDADNRLLWRMNRRKLEAEAVRDAMLLVSGRLDVTMGGPSFQDFVIEKPEHSPHYQYHLYDPEDPATHRRTIYRFLVRSQPQPFMAALDCADPSMQVAKRNESVTALQSLAMLNNAFVITMSRHFAQRWDDLDMPLEDRVQHAFESAIGRAPTQGEQVQLVEFAGEHGLENLCRLLFNLNEFSFVD